MALPYAVSCLLWELPVGDGILLSYKIILPTLNLTDHTQVNINNLMVYYCGDDALKHRVEVGAIYCCLKHNTLIKG